MNIQEELQPIAKEIEKIANGCNGWNIGTTLQDYLQGEMKKILPPTIGYQFNFSTSGMTEHVFYETANQNNTWTI